MLIEPLIRSRQIIAPTDVLWHIVPVQLPPVLPLPVMSLQTFPASASNCANRTTVYLECKTFQQQPLRVHSSTIFVPMNALQLAPTVWCDEKSAAEIHVIAGSGVTSPPNFSMFVVPENLSVTSSVVVYSNGHMSRISVFCRCFCCVVISQVLREMMLEWLLVVLSSHAGSVMNIATRTQGISGCFFFVGARTLFTAANAT